MALKGRHQVKDKREKVTLGTLGLILKLCERKRKDGQDVVPTSRGRAPADVSWERVL